MGSADFAESVLLAELYAQVLEANGYTVERHLNIGAREVMSQAFTSGDIDMWPEYIGSYLAFLDPTATVSASLSADQKAAAEAQAIQAVLPSKGLTLLKYSQATDANVFAVTQDTVKKYLTPAGAPTPTPVPAGSKSPAPKLSDLVPIADQLILGGPAECPVRPYCAYGLNKTYGIPFKVDLGSTDPNLKIPVVSASPQGMDFKALDAGGPFTVQALVADQIQVGLLFSSDPIIDALNLVLLQDDKNLQPSENVGPVVRSDKLNQSPAIRDLADSVSSQLTTMDLVDMNFQVGPSGNRRDPKTVAGNYLRGKGLIK